MKNKISSVFSFVVVALFAFLVAIPTSASPVGGTKIFRGDIQANDSVVVDLLLRGDETTKIRLSGDGSTDVDCYLFDENFNQVGSDADDTDTCLIYANPRWTGVFHLKVMNRGRVYNSVVIMAQ